MKRGFGKLLGAIILFLGLSWLGLGLTAQSIPPISNVIAIMQEPPRATTGLALVDSGSALHVIRTVYKVLKPSCLVEIYVSRDPRPFKLGSSNVIMTVTIGKSPVVSLEYRVLKKKPSYCVQRTDGLWFLFAFPDEPVDVRLFIQRFGEAYGYFESNLGGQKIEDCLPSVIGDMSKN